MVTLAGLARTLTTAKKPYRVLFLKFSNKRKQITLRNDCTLNLTWPQFRILRDNYNLIREYSIEQVNDDVFRLKSDNFAYSVPLEIACLIAELKKKYDVEQLEDDLFKIKSDKFELFGSSQMMYSIRELDNGEYDCDCRGKVVLDVGGFQGESAVFFSVMGAKKVIIYEPVLAHHRFIQKNVQTNNVSAEIHEAGIGATDGIQTIHYDDAAGLGFGLIDKGQCEMEIKTKAVSKVIEESQANVAKFDCEGAETYLVQVSVDVLRRVDLYMVEVHSPDIRKAIVEKFASSGFSLMKESAKDDVYSVIFFSRTN